MIFKYLVFIFSLSLIFFSCGSNDINPRIIRGKRDKGDIIRAVVIQIAAMKYHFTKISDATYNKDYKFGVQATVLKNGNIIKCKLINSTINDSALSNKLLAILKSMSFEKIEFKDKTTFTCEILTDFNSIYKKVLPDTNCTHQIEIDTTHILELVRNYSISNLNMNAENLRVDWDDNNYKWTTNVRWKYLLCYKSLYDSLGNYCYQSIIIKERIPDSRDDLFGEDMLGFIGYCLVDLQENKVISFVR